MTKRNESTNEMEMTSKGIVLVFQELGEVLGSKFMDWVKFNKANFKGSCKKEFLSICNCTVKNKSEYATRICWLKSHFPG